MGASMAARAGTENSAWQAARPVETRMAWRAARGHPESEGAPPSIREKLEEEDRGSGNVLRVRDCPWTRLTRTIAGGPAQTYDGPGKPEDQVADFELLKGRYRTADNAHPVVWAAEGVWAAQREDRMAKRSRGLNCVAASGKLSFYLRMFCLMGNLPSFGRPPLILQPFRRTHPGHA